jgi:acetylornithine deacetylase/succinyl-diaminopimelate desuccinylase-like protein
MNCGEETGDPLGAKTFSHYFLKSLPGFERELSTLEKLELAVMLEKFPSLPKTEFIWNEGSFGEKTQLAPKILVPVATSQKGYWLGRLSVSGKSGHGALSSDKTALEIIQKAMGALYAENRSWKSRFRSLHSEMQELVSIIRPELPFWQRFLLWLYPRLFFEVAGLQSMVTSWWVPSQVETNASMPNVIASKVSVTVEYRFLGEKESLSIENHLRKIFEREMTEGFELEIKTTEFVPFRRDFFKGSEAKIFRQVLESQPQTIVSPFITPGITDSRYFRLSGVKAFDLVPFFLTQEQIRSMHGHDERLPYLELKRAIDIESRILEKLLQ